MFTLMVTSPGPKEGKSLVAANLAVAMAQSGKRVILVDADQAAGRALEARGSVPLCLLPNRPLPFCPLQHLARK